MEISKDFLQAEIAKFERQRDHAHDVAVASQAAVDVLRGLVQRLELPEESIPTFEQMGLPEPVPVESIKHKIFPIDN
jgi:hypothetical protein